MANKLPKTKMNYLLTKHSQYCFLQINRPILMVSLICLLGDCDNRTTDGTMGTKTEAYFGETTVELIKYDGCEYLIFYTPRFSGRYAVVHKANCNNPIHKQR